MKIAIDLRPLQIGHENRGIGAYLVNILRYIPKDAQYEYVFLRYDVSNPIRKYGIADGITYKEIVFKKYVFIPKPLPAIRFFFATLKPKYIRLLKFQPDVYFQADYLLGVPPLFICRKRIVVCYDLIPLKFRSMYLKPWTHYFKLRNLRMRSRIRQSLRAMYYSSKYNKGLRTLRHSQKVLSISGTTTSDLRTLARVNPKKIYTIPLAPSYVDNIRSKKITELANTLSKKYLFYIGGADKRREIKVLISTFNKLNARGNPMHLVLAGNEFEKNSKIVSHDIKKAIDKSSYQDNLHLLGKISDGDKRILMKHCAIFIYPSLYEGFGLPILEAMEANAPILSYKNSSIYEIAGDSIHYCKEHSSSSMRNSVITILNQKKPTQSYNTVLNNYSWNKTALATWQQITSLN